MRLRLIGLTRDAAVFWETIEAGPGTLRDDLVVVGLRHGEVRERREGPNYPGGRRPDIPSCALADEARWGAPVLVEPTWLGCYGDDFEQDFRVRARLAVEIRDRERQPADPGTGHLQVDRSSDGSAAYSVRGPRPSDPPEVQATLVRWRASNDSVDAFPLELDGPVSRDARVVARDANTLAVMPHGPVSPSLWLVALSADRTITRQLWGAPREMVRDATWWAEGLLFLHGDYERTCLDRHSERGLETVLCVDEELHDIRVVDSHGLLLANDWGEHLVFSWDGRLVERLRTGRSRLLTVVGRGVVLDFPYGGTGPTLFRPGARAVELALGHRVLAAEATGDALFILQERSEATGERTLELTARRLTRSGAQ